MPDLKQLLKEAAAQGATTEQLDIIYNAYQDNVKKKAQSTASLTGGVGSVPGLEPFQQFKPGVNKYVKQPAPVAPAIRNQARAPQTVAQAQKQNPVAFSPEAFKQEAVKNPTAGGANLMTGLTSTASGFYRIPKLIYDTFAAPQNLAADILNKPELRANYDNISKGTFNPLGVIDKTADYLQQSSKEWSEKKRKYDSNITTQLSKGDFGGAAKQIGDQIEESIPGMLSMYLTGPLAAAGKFAPTARTLTMAAPFAGSQLNEIKDNPNIPDYLKPVNAWLNGTAEVVLEEQFGTKALVDDALRIAKTEGREAAVNTIKNVLRPLGERFIKKVQPVTNVLGNGLEEGITTFSQNIIDKYTGVDPNRGLLDNVSDSIIVGTAQGTGATALGKGMDVLTNQKSKTKIDALSKQRDDLMNDLDSPSIPDNIKGGLVDKLTDINEEINSVLDDNRAEYDALDYDDIAELQRLNNNIEDTEDILNNESLSETSRQLAQNDLVALQKELAAKQKDVSTKVKQFKTQANAIQEPSTTGQVPPVTEGGQNLQEGGEGVGQGVEGTQAPQAISQEKVDLKLNYNGELYNASYQGYKPLTSDSSLNIEEGLGLNSYNISTKNGDFISGLISNADFPSEGKSIKRGEVLNLNVNEKRKGTGKSLMIDALRIMKLNGTDIVKFTMPSKEGKPFNDKLESEGYIEKIRTAKDSPTTEYRITDKVISKTESTTQAPQETPIQEPTTAINQEEVTPLNVYFDKTLEGKNKWVIDIQDEGLKNQFEEDQEDVLYRTKGEAVQAFNDWFKSKTEAPKEFISEEVSRLREQEQAEYAAMKNPNDAVKREAIYNKYDKPITKAIREAKQQGVRTVKLEVNEDLTNNGIGLRAVEMPDGKFGIFKEVDGKVTGKSLGRSFETIEELQSAYEGGIKDRLTADAIRKAEGGAEREVTKPSMSIEELDKIPRGETFQERLAPEYYESLKQDIKENGIKEPIVLQYYYKDNAMRLGEGHHRLKIAKELGIKNIPVKINVIWNKSIKDFEANKDIQNQEVYSPKKSLNIEEYRRRDYFPSEVKLEELGFENTSKSQKPSQTPKEIIAKEEVVQPASEEQARLHNEQEGSTFTVDGVNRNGTKAASVSIFPERTKIVEGELAKEDIDTYVKENSDIYAGNGDVLAVGTWRNTETGENYLDVSAVLPKKEATRLGKDYNQISVWDLEKGREIPTGGTGEAIEGLKPEIDRVSDIRTILSSQKALKQAEVKVEEKAPTKAIPAKKTKELANLVKQGNIDEFLKQINDLGDVEFSTKIVENIQDQSFDAVVDEMNQLSDNKVAFSIDDEISDGGTIDIEGVQEREGLVKKPKYVKISDYAGKTIMLTISDQLSSGNTVNPFTGNPIKNLNGGLFFNNTNGNVGFGWAYTDYKVANDALNRAKDIYNLNPELYPDGIVPVAVVKMGEDSITSNEAVSRVLFDNLTLFPDSNKKAAFKAVKIDIKKLADLSLSRAKASESAGDANANALKDYKAYSAVLDYLNSFKDYNDAFNVDNIKKLQISVIPYLVKRLTIGSVQSDLPTISIRKDKPAVAELLNGFDKKTVKEMAKAIHLAYVADVVSEKALSNVPARHIIAFVGIDVNADAPVKSNHPNYPYALKGKGLGIVKNTKHLASVFPQAYGNAISKYLNSKTKEPISSTTALSQAAYSGLSDILYRNKSLNLDNDNVAKLIGFMNVAFPSVRFMSDANSWNDIINSDNVQKYTVNGETIYGLTTNGDIYLNPEFKDLNTPIHEMGHIWIDFIQTTNQNLYNKGLSLVENTPEFEASKKVYGDTDKARKEALAILIGNRGENIANASQKSKFKKWLLGMWEYLQTKFPNLRNLSVKEIENLTLDQFVGGVLRDIVGGKAITKDLSALKISDQFRGEVNFRSVKADAVDVLARMLKSKLITQEQYNNAMERVGATTSIKNAEVEAKRAEYGFPEPAQRPFQSNKTTLDKAKQAIKEGVSVNEVIEKALSREPITDVESAMIALYQGTKEAELLKANSDIEQLILSNALDFTDAVDKRNKIIDDLVNAYNAGEVSGNVSARALQARKIKVLQDDSLANMLIQKRKANNNRKLTNKQVDDISKLYTKINVAKSALEAKIEKLNEENAKLKLKAAIPNIIKDVKAEKTGKSKEQLKAEREDIFKQMSELARKSRANLSANPVPVEMIPLVVKLAKNYLATGAKTLEEVIDKVYDDLSGYVENVSKNDIRRTLADYDGDTRPTKEDIQEEVFGERSKEKQIQDIEDLENQAKKEQDPETAKILQDEANTKRTAMEKQAEKDGLDKEQKRLDNYKKNIQKRIDELQGKLKKGDYSKTPKNEIKLDDEARKLKKQLEDIKFEFAVELEKDALAGRNKVQKFTDGLIELFNLPRALMATADFSAPLRQAAVVTIAYPDIAAKAAIEMGVQWSSSEKAEQWMDDLMESPGYKLIKDSGLYIANVRSAKLSAKEEDFATNLAGKIPVAGALVNASERAYVAYLNKMRVDIFNRGVELLQNDGYSFATNPKAYKTLANYVNAATGRGGLGGGALEKAGPALNALMFSPRLLASRVRLLTMLADPRIYKKENRIVRNMYLKDMSSFVGFGLAVLALAAAAGADVEDDPRSTDFGKIKVGDTRWDIWGGFQQPIRAFVQATLEERKSTTTGKIVKLDGSGYGGETGGDVILRFFRGKLAPVPAFLVNAYTGKDVMGTPFNITDGLVQMSYPLVIQSVVESAKKDGVVFGVLATGVPSLLGVGVQTYGANDFLKQGVDDKSINLLLSKKAIAIEPNELDTKVFDVNTGEDRKMSDEEFKKYYADWADYIKMKLRDNYDEYKDMSVEEFETEFRSIKSEATKLAKEEISGVSNSTKTISYRDGDESESYKLTPEELKYRQSLNEQYISRHGNVYNKELRDAIRDGKSPEEAAIIANKRLISKANEYSRKVILKQRKRGRGYDF